MTDKEWEKIKGWLDELIELPEKEKEQRLTELKKTDALLYSEVKKLVDAIDQSDGFLEKRAQDYATTLLSNIGARQRKKNED